MPSVLAISGRMPGVLAVEDAAWDSASREMVPATQRAVVVVLADFHGGEVVRQGIEVMEGGAACGGQVTVGGVIGALSHNPSDPPVRE